MNPSSLRNLLMLVAFILLISGAILKLKGHSVAWYLLGISIVLYIFARFFLRAGRRSDRNNKY